MKLKLVTLTGADDSVDPPELINLWEMFPYVEWGVLWSQKHSGGSRFPSDTWIRWMKEESVRALANNFSLHLCGKVVREMLAGRITKETLDLAEGFNRAQLNFHCDQIQPDYAGFESCLRDLRGCVEQIIFQFDGVKGQEYFDGLFEREPERLSIVPLFDTSGGAGVVPRDWPKPEYCTTDADYCLHGYAGGLGPDNLADELERIARATTVRGMNDPQIWIDMETKVRSDNDQLFDLAKCKRVLEIAEPFISR